ncbi:MAG: (Fe-S)-binding protein [Rikenellaceae bacterium]|nr:(Fe-S)-binding protein [Rikenellaceae bacterium]MDE7355274.1 (Fe-S)-binding protein [Rikenellaceae bacterium]
MVNLYFEPFIIPFCIGVVFLFSVMWTKFISWISALPKSDRRMIRRNIFSSATLMALWEAFRECLLHLRIMRVNGRLWYMHTSLAFGWFLLIVFGKVEAILYLKSPVVPIYVDVFFRKYFPFAHIGWLGVVMDALLLFVLSGLTAAIIKRFRPSVYGMKRTTTHTLGDKLALSTLWFIFPLRLLAESFNSAIYDSGSFLTGSLGVVLAAIFPSKALPYINETMWWCYSIALGLFFVSVPVSRYLHIFAEIPLVFLRSFKVRTSVRATTFTKLQLAACSRCGICIDPCQLAANEISCDTQSVYLLRDEREGGASLAKADSCLLCGRCERMCPVGIKLDTIRTSVRHNRRKDTSTFDYGYIASADVTLPSAKTGFFSGCMGRLTPSVQASMKKIADKSGIAIWFIDQEEGICCGRPQRMAGNIDAADSMRERIEEMVVESGITTLVTSCPICLRTFTEDYNLGDIRIIHHSQFIAELMEQGLLDVEHTEAGFAYHDPCELGRGLKIYDQPRQVIARLGQLHEPAHHRDNALCCGGSLAHMGLELDKRVMIASSVSRELEQTGADCIVTSCPLCKKMLAKSSNLRVADIAEAVSEHI